VLPSLCDEIHPCSSQRQIHMQHLSLILSLAKYLSPYLFLFGCMALG
jgi:hypothetical protein